MDSCCLIKPICLGILLSCSEPFQENRHDLKDFRIAAASVIDGIGDAVIWSGYGRVHQTSPQLEWFIGDNKVGDGYSVLLPEAEEYRLEVSNTEGLTLRSHVLSGTTRTEFSLNLSLVQFDQYDLDHRSQQATIPFADHVPESHHLRISSSSEIGKMRWMSAQGVGTFLELSPYQTDFIFADIEYDSGDYVLAASTEASFASLFALNIDDTGNTNWKWFDVFRDSVEQHVDINDVKIQTDTSDFPTGLVKGLISWDENHLLLSNISSIDSLDGRNDFLCAIPSQPFDITWLFSGRCALNEVDGEFIALEIQ